MRYIGMILFLSLVILGCEEEYTPETSGIEEFVVEGFIEAGENTNPAYVIITRSIPFLQEINLDIFENLFVTNAFVEVSDGNNTVSLQRICLEDLPPEIQMSFTDQLGLLSDSLMVNYCVYIDINDELSRVEEGIYDLNISIEEHQITGQTTIPKIIKLDSTWFQDTPGMSIDTLAELWGTIRDEPKVANFYRFLSGSPQEGFDAPFTSVIDDIFFEGKEFDFPLAKAQDRDDDFDPETFGFFNVGDTITVKWLSIDQSHYDFWLTYEYILNAQGPFTSYIRVKHNVDGALGVWGGYGVDFHTLVVEK